MAEGNYIGRLIPEGYLTRRELASLADCSYDTIIRLEKAGVLSPSAIMESGKVGTHLYAEDHPDVIRLIDQAKAKR